MVRVTYGIDNIAVQYPRKYLKIYYAIEEKDVLDNTTDVLSKDKEAVCRE